MNKMQTIAKITLVSLGIFIVIEILKTILPSVIVLIFSKQDEKSLTLNILSIGLIVLLTIATIFFLIVRSTSIAQKITANYQEAAGQGTGEWLATAYRIIFVIMGLLFLYMTVPGFVVFLLQIASAVKNGKTIGFGLAAIPFCSYLVKTAIAVYLIMGAPHIVRRQVGKSQPPQAEAEQQAQSSS